MPDAVACRKRQVSTLRRCGSKGASSNTLYKGRRRRRESGSRERNSRVILVEASLAGKLSGCCSAMKRFAIDDTLVWRNLARSFQAWEIRVSEITRAPRSIAFNRSDQDASRRQRETNGCYLPKVNE
jgi:hypothetical protein